MQIIINIIRYFLTSPALTICIVVLMTIALVFICDFQVNFRYKRRIKNQPNKKEYLEKELEKERLYNLIYWFALLIILIAPMLINLAFFSISQYSPTASPLTNKEWLGFWGSYMGGVVSAIAAVVAFFFTYRQNQKQHEETRKQMEAQNRLKILAVLSLDLNGRNIANIDTRYQCLYLSNVLANIPQDTGFSFMEYEVKNISQSAALFFTLGDGDDDCAVNHLLPQTETKIHLAAPWSDKDYKGCFRLCFFDIEGTSYEQQVDFSYRSNVDRPGILLLQQPKFPQLVSNPSCKTDPSTRQPSEVSL